VKRAAATVLPFLAAFLVCVALAIVPAGCGGGGGNSSNNGTAGARSFPLTSLNRITLNANGQTLRLWVMDTPEKRAEGMMHLDDADVQADEGMLFAYPNSAVRFFWMKDTRIPLDIAFLDANGVVVSTSAMQPFDVTNGTSSFQPAQYAIEVKQGTLARVGITTGMRLELPPVSAR
jgi:hypothetical protein